MCRATPAPPAPSATKSRAIALPIPRPPPVTIALRPSSASIVGLLTGGPTHHRQSQIVVVDLTGGPFQHLLTAVDDQDPVREFVQLLEIESDEEDGSTPVAHLEQPEMDVVDTAATAATA